MSGSSNGTNGVVEKAIKICDRGAWHPPAAQHLIAQAAAALFTPFAPTEADRAVLARLASADLRIADRPALTAMEDRAEVGPAERRIVEQALKLATYGPTPFPAPPPDPALLLKLAEAAAVAEGARLLAQQARDQRVLVVVALQQAKGPAEVERLAAELRRLEEQDLVAEENWRRAGVALRRIERRIAGRQLAATIEESRA